RGPRLAAAAGLAAAGGLAWATLGSDGDAPAGSAVNDRVPTATTVVSRRDLVDRHDVEGTLSYTGQRTIGAAVRGTLTRVRPEGSTVRRGESVYSIDAKATAYVMYGQVPMYRTLQAGVDNGSDVRQLERNLVALGYDPYDAIDVDNHWDSATTAAVIRWQKARGLQRDGMVEPGDIVFSDGPLRVGEHEAAVGDAVGAGAAVTAVSSRRRVVIARLGASRQAQVRRGQRVRVTLPDGSEVSGRVTRVGRVAQAGKDDAEASVELRVALLGKRARRARLDQAPVTVSIAASTAKGVLTVPVTALVAIGNGRYGVEVEDARGARRLVPVTTGAFADGYVEVRGIAQGARVVVPR
ncbi:MAG TPA: peptidoglycan-binding protein, partial [Solirubrobacteraceae bacterium]|nr:peptidoglycan-binding protein [Solirubrobacteraceae bacterium]